MTTNRNKSCVIDLVTWLFRLYIVIGKGKEDVVQPLGIYSKLGAEFNPRIKNHQLRTQLHITSLRAVLRVHRMNRHLLSRGCFFKKKFKKRRNSI
jgi:hypothetical protein